MIAVQRLTPAQWKAEVEKMITWGAFVFKSDQEPLIDYLSRHFRDTDPPSKPELITLVALQSPEIPSRSDAEETVEGDPAKGKVLFQTFCAYCHGPTAMGGEFGPSLANRAIIGHTAAYNQIVQEGLRAMPPFDPALKPEQQRDILSWLRALPRETDAPTPAPAP